VYKVEDKIVVEEPNIVL